MTPDQIEQARQVLRERLIESLAHCYPTVEGDEGCDADIALDKLVVFERADMADHRRGSCCAQPDQIGWCHKSANPCANCVANDEAKAELAQLVKEALA